jgi:hypothetical protein
VRAFSQQSTLIADGSNHHFGRRKFIWEKIRLCVIVRIGWIKVGFWWSNLDAHFFIWDEKDVVYTVRIGLIKDGLAV